MRPLVIDNLLNDLLNYGNAYWSVEDTEDYFLIERIPPNQHICWRLLND